jgi:hypothetical protein
MRRASGYLLIAAVMVVVVVLGSARVAHAQGSGSVPTQSAPADVPAWRENLAHAPPPYKGCFTARYPSTTWQKIPCSPPSRAIPRPYPPRTSTRTRATTVGNGDDVSLMPPTSATITEAVGSFDTVTDVTSESDGGTANSFSIQLNTNFVSGSPACSGATSASACQVWEQFVFSTGECDGACGFIQYWLLNYNNACPAGWISYGNDCFKNSAMVVDVPTQVIADLATMSVIATANTGGNDTMSFVTGTTPVVYSFSESDDVVDIAAGWSNAEFNIFGDCCSTGAAFNNGAALTVRTAANYGSLSAPVCVDDGFTGETNSLSFGSAPVSPAMTTLPAVVFNETSISSINTPCMGSVVVAGTGSGEERIFV